MKAYKSYVQRLSTIKLVLVILYTSIGIQACNPDKKQTNSNPGAVAKENVVEIVTQNMDFQMPDTITSGWNTFRYINQSPQTHFFTVEKYPEGKTMEDVKTLVIPYFDSGMKLINEGKNEAGFAEFGNLPEWFAEVKVLGGSGLVSPGNISETMIRLEPGHYFIECYVKMSNGVFHSSMGMFREFDVSDTNSGNKELEADYKINISSNEGIAFSDSIKAGTRTFSVFFQDQRVHENFAGHDINLARLDDAADLNDLENWMNWVDPKGLIEPAPTGAIFIGGVNNMPAGGKGYFTVNLESGKYLLISEVPNAMRKNMLKTFEVSN